MKFPFFILLSSIALAFIFRNHILERKVIQSVINVVQEHLSHLLANSKAEVNLETEPTTPFLGQQSKSEVPEIMSVARGIAKVFKAVEQSEGAGARVRRSIGTRNLRNFSPFLMLDHFTIGAGAGFPDHPHR